MSRNVSWLPLAISLQGHASSAMKYSHSSFVKVIAICSGVASQNAVMRRMLSRILDPERLLALDSFRSLPLMKNGSNPFPSLPKSIHE